MRMVERGDHGGGPAQVEGVGGKVVPDDGSHCRRGPTPLGDRAEFGHFNDTWDWPRRTRLKSEERGQGFVFSWVQDPAGCQADPFRRASRMVDNGHMPGHYLPEAEPDLDDFFSQIVPLPPPSNPVGGIVFIAPFDPTLERWFGYRRYDTKVERFEGSYEAVKQWAKVQEVAERWIYATDLSAYVPWPEPTCRAPATGDPDV